ncbi:hypothetical protein NCS52_01399000 [Fusarium sp. LHS14.1]|nr:hypothetical protein NCS52_01399000 [Fusarium sp. LHS14.1]
MATAIASSATVVTCFASFGAARNCTPNLYCGGSSLLDIGNYYDDIEDALAATKQGICTDRKHVKNSLFYCAPGTNGAIKYKGCKNIGIGKSDKC